MKDREQIEKYRLRERTGGYHKFTEGAHLHAPDQNSSHFISDQERFDKDFSVVEAKIRHQKVEKEQERLQKLREQRFEREAKRFEDMEALENRQHEILIAKRDHFNAGKKNQGGAAYNLLNFGYDANTQGQRLAQHDQDAQVRGMMRAKFINERGNGRFNILTGSERAAIDVPQHQRYNPISQAGTAIMGSGPPSRGSQASRGTGCLPGMY